MGRLGGAVAGQGATVSTPAPFLDDSSSSTDRDGGQLVAWLLLWSGPALVFLTALMMAR